MPGIEVIGECNSSMSFLISVSISSISSENTRIRATVCLSSKDFIVLEDVERSSIDIIEIMGYVNNLVEQDGVKVLLVANEDEIKRYEKKSETEKNEQGETSKDLTEKSKEYVRIKEKTVSDTIYFHADLVASIESILRLFENAYFDGALKDRIQVNIRFVLTATIIGARTWERPTEFVQAQLLLRITIWVRDVLR